MGFDIGKLGFNPQFGSYQKGTVGAQPFKGGQQPQGLTKQQPSNGFDWHSLAKFDNQPPVVAGQASHLGNKLDYFV